MKKIVNSQICAKENVLDHQHCCKSRGLIFSTSLGSMNGNYTYERLQNIFY